MEYKTLAELAIDNIFELDDSYKNKFKNAVQIHYPFETTGCLIKEEGVFGPYSDFILYLDARDKIIKEDDFNMDIGKPIIEELTQNIRKQYGAMYDNLDYFNNRFAACMSIRRRPDHYVFDFADSGIGITEAQIGDFQIKSLAARKAASGKVTHEDTKIFLGLSREFEDANDPGNKRTVNSGGMALVNIFSACLKADGKFMIAYNFRDIKTGGVEKRVCDVYSSVEENLHLKKTKDPVHLIDKALNYKTKTHVRIKLPIPFILDSEKKIAEKTQAIERASLVEMPSIDEFTDYLTDVEKE